MAKQILNRQQSTEDALKQALAELAQTKEQLEKTQAGREEFRRKYFQFKGIFQRQTQTFYQYQSLSKPSLAALDGVFRGTTFEEFLACGVQPGNIDTIWEFSRSQALAGNLPDVAILSQMITYFVNLYNDTNESPILGFQHVEPGDAFDMDVHIRTQQSKASGKITNVLLLGLTNAFTGEVIKKAVVEVG